MFLNKIFSFAQNITQNLYKNSLVLQNIDKLIFLCLALLIVSSIFMPSDNIGNFAFVMIFLTIIKLCTKPNARLYFSSGDVFLVMYLLLVLISVAGSSLFALSLKGFCKTVVYVGFYFSFVDFIRSNKRMIKYVFLLIALMAFVESGFAIMQNFMSVSEISGWQDMSRLNPEEVMTRVYGTLKPFNPNLFGGFMLAIAPTTVVAFVLPFLNKHLKTSLTCVLVFVLTILSIILTGCRGAYIGLFFELCFLALIMFKFLKPKFRKLFATITACLSTIILFLMLSITSVRARLISIFAMRNDSSNSFRFNVYNSCVQMFKDNWILGIGVGNQNFREIYGLYMKTGFDALSAYNIYLELAVESGIFALLAFVSMIITNLVKAVKYLKRRNNITSFYIAIAFASLLGILIHGFVDTVFFRPQIQFIFWIMLGIIRVLTAKNREKLLYDRR